jgi:integrase
MRSALTERCAMSVRKEKRRNPKTGAVWEKYRVDVAVAMPDGSTKRVSRDAPVQTKRDAEKFELELRRSILDGTFGRKEEKPVPTLAEFEKEFISNYAEANNKLSEVQTKKSAIKNHLVPAFGKLKLDQIGSREIEAFKSAKIKEKKAAKSVNNYLTVLRKMLSVAQEWGLIPFVPKVKWLRVPPNKFDFLTFEEADRLMAAADGEWRPMITVALKTGLRQGELLALAWDDIDLVAGRLVVSRNLSRGEITTPKNGKTREIPLGDDVLAALKRHRHLRGDVVFCTSAGSMFTKGESKHPLWRACKRAGLRRIGWHVLRHTFASHLVMRGAVLKSVQELLGHGTIKMTERYAHLSPDVRKDAVRLLDRPGAQVHAHAALMSGEAEPKSA